MLHLTSAKTVGWTKYPVCPIRFPPHISFAPWDLPDSISSKILSIWTSSIWQQRQFTTSQWVHCMLRPRRRPALMASLARRRAHHRLGRPNKKIPHSRRVCPAHDDAMTSIASALVDGLAAQLLSDLVRDLEVTLDSKLSMQNHVNKVARTCFYHIRRLKQVWKLLGPDVAAKLVVSLVFSKLDYCNAILAGLTRSTIAPYQT